MYLTDLDKNGVAALMTEWAQPRFRTDQVMAWLNAGVRPEGMSNLPKALREKLSALPYGGSTIERKLVSSKDGTAKYLFLLEDGNLVEGVLMHYSYGNTACISTQVGCRMGCKFCASTLEGCVRDLRPGEMAIVDKNGLRFDTAHCDKEPKHFCVFEYIYFARPDSVIDGASVSLCRRRAGRFLAKEHPVDADIVIGVPDSGLEAAIGYSYESGIPYAIGFTKNKYIARTFITPGQGSRETGVGIKLNPIREIVKDKRVVLIDDSIVRGTTCRRIAELLWQAGVKEIHMRVSAPPFVAPCYYGTDIDSADVLIANRMSTAEIAKEIGVTSLGYLSVENVRLLTGTDSGFCTACFGGSYPTAIPDKTAKNRFETKISEQQKG